MAGVSQPLECACRARGASGLSKGFARRCAKEETRPESDDSDPNQDRERSEGRRKSPAIGREAHPRRNAGDDEAVHHPLHGQRRRACLRG